MSRSTFSILPYINRQKVKADGTANILCRITVDGKSAAISTGISCTPQEWNAKKGEVRNARDNGRLASFLAEVKDKYNSLLSTNGIITVEMLKAVLKDKDTTGRFLLNFGDTIVEWYRTAKARLTFLHKRTWQKNLRDFVHSLDKDDIAFEDIDENFGEEYKLFLKRDQGRTRFETGEPGGYRFTVNFKFRRYFVCHTLGSNIGISELIPAVFLCSGKCRNNLTAADNIHC